ncbi:unnamed protein product, partial [Closterium sp. NIES-65]
MAEAVAVMRAKKKAAANGEREGPVLTRSESLLDEKFDAYEAANYRMWARSKSDAFSRRSSTSADESCSDGADGADSEDGAEGGEGKATAEGGPLKRSLTEDTTGKTMARGALDGLARSASDVTLQDAEMDEMDREVLQEAFVRVVALQQRVQHYRDLGGFVVLMALFITILYLQADSSRSYEITSAHAVLFPPGMSQDASNTFNGPDDFYSWLNTSIVQTLWADPTCGDGSCDRPFQFPAFGRFGCEADCGTFPNLTSVIIRFSSHLDTQQAADESSWNLCMVDPVSLCWYEAFQPFPRGESEVSVALDIPDGDWVVVLIAPAGGIRGTVHAPPPGTRRLSVVGAASSIELVAWGSCSLDDGLASTNQTQPGGSAAGASPDICRDTCARLVVCLPATCGRAFTEREVAGAFVDCARMCIVAPSSITSYANASCPTVRFQLHVAVPHASLLIPCLVIPILFRAYLSSGSIPCPHHAHPSLHSPYQLLSDALLSLSVAVCPLDMSLALPASACRSLPLRAAPCLCVPLPASACRSLPLRAAPCLCVPLPASACRSLPLRAAPCLCVPLPASACRSLPLRAAPCLCVPFPASVCRSLPLCAAPCLCVPLPASADTFHPADHISGGNRRKVTCSPIYAIPLRLSRLLSLALCVSSCECCFPAARCRSPLLTAALTSPVACSCSHLAANSVIQSFTASVSQPLLPYPFPQNPWCMAALCSQALYRFHHSHSYDRWPASTAPGPLDTSSLPAAAGVRSLAAPAVDSPAASASAASTALAEAHPLETQRFERLTALQVAVSRALFTVTKDQCLAGHGPGANRKHSQGGPGSLRWNMVACFCTMLGGPVTTLDECRLTDTAGRQVLSISDMYVYLRSTHVRGGRVISAQHMRRFVQTVAAALRSVTLISDAAAARLNTLMHSFDDAIATSDAVGCSQGGAWLPWRAGVKHNTTIHVGDKVTWVWDDDLPHSLKVAAMGEAEDPLFLGFGGNRLVVSRLLTCTHMNVGAGDTVEEPQPCVLRMDDESPGSFAYSKVFYEPLTIHYEDGTLSLDDSSSSSDVSLLTVLPARAGAEVAGGVHATDSSTLSSTAHFTTASTITPSTTTTSSSSPSSSPSSSSSPSASTATAAAAAAATYECSPGCRLRRLANGVCDAACNTPACAFDGGDCACVDPLFGPGICSCPPGHTRHDDGSCCLSTAVGANLNFPFSLQRYGPNYTESNHAFAAERGIAVNRYVSRHNRLLIGMVLQQDRWGTQHCNGSGLLHLAGWCSNGTSLEPFGVNPHFLPTSAIYNSAASANMSQLDNNTFGVKLKFNPQGLPYGFIYPMASLTTLPLVFDINLDYEAAMRRLHYLVDGGYIDNGTRTVDVSFITFNGETLTFVLTTVRCTLNAGGSMAVTFRSQPAAMAMYDASADNIARLVLEVVYLVGLLWNVCGELQEMADRAAVDVLSLALLLWASMEL